ncbi:MAG: hypothetical protein ACRDL3_12410 [Solirubrobacterales bacterium]
MKGLFTICALVGALAVAPAAVAKTHNLSGPVEGDANARISMKVVVKKGQPKKVKAFAWQGLDGFCDDSFVGEQTGTTSLKTKPFPSPFRIFGSYDQAASPGDTVDISGTVKRKGKKIVRGLIAVSFDGGFCTAPPPERRSFTATK